MKEFNSDNTDDKTLENFEKELFEAMRFYGFSLPCSDPELERFEKMKGKTEIELPDSLQDFNSLSNKLSKKAENNKVRNLSKGFSIAAREGDVLPEEVVKKMQRLMDESESTDIDPDED